MITLTDVTRRFGSGSGQRVAVDRLSMTIAPGEVLGLLGPNGAGKTTTISMIVGLLRPSDGRITLSVPGVAGELDPFDASAKSHLGIATQSVSLYDELSGKENLRLFGSLFSLSRSTLATRVEECLRLVGLTDRAGDRVEAYSGGMKRRLNVAAALVHDPAIVLLDEPTAGVDPHSRHALFEIVRHLKSQGKTVIYSTHYMEEAQQLCDRVAIIDHGKLLALGSVDDLIRQHGGSSIVRIQRVNADAPEVTVTDEPLETLRLALSESERANVKSAGVQSPDLQAVFLSLTGRELRD
ncbi:MAG: ABC transporter ATP-binding protein [Phycisphaerales bacterium]|nr:ABC transporter ATP-binding protein [Phycisphaerales bacterium]